MSNLSILNDQKGDEVRKQSKIEEAIRHPLHIAKVVLRKIFRKILGLPLKTKFSDFLGNIKVNIIDIGAAGGFGDWDRIGNNLSIFLFEPEKEAFDRLVNGYKNDLRVKVYNTAVSDGGSIKLNITKWPRSSSVYLVDPEYAEDCNIRDHYKVVNTLDIPAKKLKDVLDENIDFIKIDTEGYELPILKGAGDLLDNCIGLCIEIYFQKVRIGMPMFSDVDQFCRDRGFTFICFKDYGVNGNFNHFLLPSKELESKGFVVACDAIYYRLPRNIISLVEEGKWGREKIYRAVAIYLSLEQFEFAYKILELALIKGLVTDKDESYKAAFKTIEEYSGYNKSPLYKFINKKVNIWA